ncbi:MAG: PASTA domain-containing protein [Clostridia bacterium]|nr:PASTA domain-containing protein [Clostridia bacterium]
MNMPSQKNRVISHVLPIAFCVVFLGLAGWLFYLQVARHDYYESKALDQQTWEIAVEPERGSIKDVNGVDLAVSLSSYQVLMAPVQLEKEEERREVAAFLSETLKLDYDTVYAQTEKKSQYLVVKRRIEDAEADLVTAFLAEHTKYKSALWVSEDIKRDYPYDNLLSTVIGFVGTDNQGLEGLESYYDSMLAGTPGKITAVRTASGASMPFEYESYQDAVDGYDVYLTVDVQLQYILEKYISAARVEHNVQSRIAGVIMNVKTGAVLGMTSKPDYDLNEPFVIKDQMTLEKLEELHTVGSTAYYEAYNKQQAEFRKNKVVTELYDPGSTFKIFTAAMALEENLVPLSETFTCTSQINMGAITYHCASHKAHGKETFKDAMANSCNVVFVTIAERIGVERFYRYFTLFGFRSKTGVGLPGEVSGIFFEEDKMTKWNLFSSSFGQTFQITPMQLITGVSAVANGGTYMEPYIVDRVVDSEGNIVVQNEPKAVSRIVSASTCATLRDFLEYTVVKGRTGYLKGYRICGKTGTSQKATSESGFESGKIIASYVCFAPADDPEIAVLVVVDEPNSTVQYGSYIAAPLGRDIMGECLEYLNIEPDYEDDGAAVSVKVPDVSKLSADEAAAKIQDAGLIVKIVGNGEKVSSQLPVADTVLYSGNTVLIYTDSQPDEVQTVTTVPDLIGKPAAECNSLLQHAGLNIKVIGDNLNYSTTLAVKQSIPAGKEVPKGTLVTVEFKGQGQ